jgi:hypothetical protein
MLMSQVKENAKAVRNPLADWSPELRALIVK